MPENNDYALLTRLGRWFFVLGLIFSFLTFAVGLTVIIYSVVKHGVMSSFSVALKTGHWVIISLLLLTVSEVIALLISIEKTVKLAVAEKSRREELSERPSVAPSQGQDILEEFGISVTEEIDRGRT